MEKVQKDAGGKLHLVCVPGEKKAHKKLAKVSQKQKKYAKKCKKTQKKRKKVVKKRIKSVKKLYGYTADIIRT